jgi:hypothetical protein
MFASTTTIYPLVSDARTGMPTTIYPYRMATSDLPRRPFARTRAVVRGQGASREDYRRETEDRIRFAGSYVAWLDTLEGEQPTSGPSAILGGTTEEYKLARRQAQAAYDSELGIAAASEAQVSVGGEEPADLGSTLDAIGDQAEGLIERAKKNPGATAAIIGGVVLLFLISRRR